MPGSTTAPGRASACVVAPVHVAFRKWNSVGTRDKDLSRLNGWPMRTPVDEPPRILWRLFD